jgi:hypothetical protein
MRSSVDTTMRVNYAYKNANGKYFHATQELTADGVVALFRKFRGSSASLYIVLDQDCLAACHQHGREMFEVQLMNERTRRRRLGQVSTDFAEECLRSIFAGDWALRDLEQHSFLYRAGAWDAAEDRNYKLARDVNHWPPPPSDE